MATLTGTLTLTRTILTEVVSNPNTVPRSVVAGTAGSISGAGQGQTKMDETQMAGSFRQYGNGNTRLIAGSTTSRVQTLAFIALSPAQVATLRALIGHLVCVRDPNGKKMFGSYLDITESVVPHSGSPESGNMLTNVGLTITQTTYSEAV
jgi:hypothetical protein